MSKECYADICDGYINDMYKLAKEHFCDGIYVKADSHPCGWDFISFERMECSNDMFYMETDIDVISGGNYISHEFEGKTVEQIIKEVGMNGWCFEIIGVDNLE